MGPRDIPLDTELKTPRCSLRAVSEDDIPMVWSASRFAGFNDGMRWDAPDPPAGVGPRLRDGSGTGALEFAFSRLDASRVVLSHATWNDASRRVAEKLGMRFLRTIPCGFEKQGNPVPELVYVLEDPGNKKTIQRYMEGFSESDHEKVLSCLTDDVEWTIHGSFHHVGKAAFDREIENPAFEPRPRIEVTRLSEEAHVVIAEGTVRTTRKAGGELHLAFCDVFEMREAKIRRLTSYLHPIAP